MRRPLARQSRNTRLIVSILLALSLAGAYLAYDLAAPRSTDLRHFDADEVARLDTAMWRSYYDRERVRLFLELAELLRTQYDMPFLRSNAVALSAARAAFVFKDGRSRADYERALPYLRDFFGSIRDVSATGFDVDEEARLELEWWIVHRERQTHQPGDLAVALADAASALYGMPRERFLEYGRLRAEAMDIRDTKAESGGVTEEDWVRIDDLLHRSWRSLRDAVN